MRSRGRLRKKSVPKTFQRIVPDRFSTPETILSGRPGSSRHDNVVLGSTHGGTYGEDSIDNMASPYLFRVIGEGILHRSGNERSFVALFGIRPFMIYQLWRLIDEDQRTMEGGMIAPKHLMWALLFMRHYNTEEVLASMVGVTEKTLRKWVWIAVDRISRLQLVRKVLCGLYSKFASHYY